VVPREAASDTSHGTIGSIERRGNSGGSRWRRSCHSMNRDRAGRCSASGPTGVAFVRPNIFSDARRATAGSMRGIWFGLRITKARCRTRRKIKRNSATDHQRAPCVRWFGVAGKNRVLAAQLSQAGRSVVLRIDHKPLAVDHLAVLHDRHADAAAAFGIDQLMAWGIVSGYSPPRSNVSKRTAVPSMCGSCGRFSGVISANW
jgi:hypothetical protein